MATKHSFGDLGGMKGCGHVDNLETSLTWDDWLQLRRYSAFCREQLTRPEQYQASR